MDHGENYLRYFSNPTVYNISIDWDDAADGSEGGYDHHGSRVIPSAMKEIIRLRVKQDEMKKRIYELEAQVPKVVIPESKPHVSGYGSYSVCACGEILDGVWRHNFCPHCGSKLNWEEK